MTQRVTCSKALKRFVPIVLSFIIGMSTLPLFASTSDDWFSASSTGDTTAINKLIDAGTGINDKGVMNMTPLMIASFFGKPNAVHVLLNANVTLNLKSGSGFTALMFASQKGHADIVKLLLDAGADKYIKSASGATALTYATENGYDAIIALLSGTVENSEPNVVETPITETVQAKPPVVSMQPVVAADMAIVQPVALEESLDTIQKPISSSTNQNISITQKPKIIQSQSEPYQSGRPLQGSMPGNKCLIINGGLNFSNFILSGDYKGDVNPTNRVGFNIGVGYFVPWDKTIGLLVGLGYETRGAKYSATYIDTEYYSTEHDNITNSLGYIQIPVLISYNLGPQLSLMIGPELGIAVSSRYSGTVSYSDAEIDTVITFDQDNMDFTSKTDISLSLNMVYAINKQLVVGFGYSLGLLNVDINIDNLFTGSMRNSNYKIFVGYKIPLL